MLENNFFSSKKLVFAVLLCAAFFAIFSAEIVKKDRIQKKLNDEILKISIYDFQSDLNKIKAKSFFVYDIKNNEILFSKDENEILPIASITKLMSGLVAIENLPKDLTIEIKKEDTELGSGTGLLTGEKWKMSELLSLSLISSSNDGIHAISRYVNDLLKNKGENIVISMNKKAKEIGMENTTFIDPTGLDIDEHLSGSYSSSFDISKLLEYIIKNHPEFIYDTSNDEKIFVSDSRIVHTIKNTNIALGKIPGIFASKTGFTDLAGGSLAVIFDAGFSHPIIAVVLNSTKEERFTDIERLSALTLIKLSNGNFVIEQ